MTLRLRYVSLLLLALTAVLPTVSQGQQGPLAAYDQSVAAPSLAQAQLDALLAPIALYPDQLLAQVLMASTHPLDVVNAARFVKQNPSLKGEALDRALQDRNWDPSVLSLTAYPQVLLMMNDMLDWTQQLGNAFLANQQQVMDTVQLLRNRAQVKGNLQSTPQQTVRNQGGFIDIEPAQPQYVYVPVYDPTVIYGPWSDPVYIPRYWYPPPSYGYPDLAPGIAAGIFFGAAWWVSPNHWGWAHPNWRGRDIDINVSNNFFAHRPQYAGQWREARWGQMAAQRDRLASDDYVPQNGYGRPFNTATQSREPFRTRDLTQPQQAISRLPPQPQAPIARPVWRAQQPMARSTPVQERETVRALPQPQQAIARSMLPLPQPTAPSIAQPDVRARSLPQPQQPFARPMPQLPRPMARSTAQPEPVLARALPQLPPPAGRLSWQQPTASPRPRLAQTTVSMPRPPQAMASSVPQPRAQQPVYNTPPQAQIPVEASHGRASPPTTGAPSMPDRHHG